MPTSRWTGSRSRLPQGVPQLPRQRFHGAARAALQLVLPLRLGLEAPVTEPLAPGLDRLANRVVVEGVTLQLARAGHHVRGHPDEGAESRARLDRVLAPRT